MICPAGSFRIFLVSEPVDFRKGMDGLVAHVANHFELDPFDGAIYVFRNDGRFTWSKPQARQSFCCAA